MEAFKNRFPNYSKHKSAAEKVERLNQHMRRKKPVSTQNKLCVGGISLSLQGSYKHVD